MIGIRRWVMLAACLWLATTSEARRKLKRDEMESLKSIDMDEEDFEDEDGIEPCQCGVFMSQQVGIKDGRRSRPRGPPQGEPVVTYDTDSPSLPCGSSGFKHCISKCLDVAITIDEDCSSTTSRSIAGPLLAQVHFQNEKSLGLSPPHWLSAVAENAHPRHTNNLQKILKYLPRAGPVICGAVERDVYREKAFLFIRNCGGQWTPTNFSAGKEFCCTDGQHHKC